MRNILLLFLTVLLVTPAGAQSNAPVRLALIAESAEASAASDLLTVELSKNPQIKLLERNEIEKVYREQGLSAANGDYLKLGQVLGADGLLLIRASEMPSSGPAMAPAFAAKQKVDLSVQLVAVKPGVLLLSEQFSAVDDVAAWGSGFVAHLDPFLPKLSVIVRDAMPISIVNLRSAMQSPETQQLERQLTTLTIERLSRERQLFVLERRKMQLLASEKQLKGLEDSAFWNGSYLLDGTIDRNGYSKESITLSAQLTPPKGGAPLAFEVSGSRTNLLGLINQLAEKICESLKLAKTAAPWNAAEEAQKYVEEAKWALKWNLLTQAQSAADSAWTLGRQDMDCALIRVDSYTREIPEVNPVSGGTYDLKGRVVFTSVTNRPDPAEINQALHLLNIYEAFGRTLPPDEPKQDSPYYNAGLKVLHKATAVLRHFYFHPESQAEARENLADLRAATRDAAAWIGRSPSVRKTYWIEGHIPTGDEIYHDFRDSSVEYWNGPKNLYEFELVSGCFWQDKPEDCLALYRSLMGSPLFICIHNSLWFPAEENPPLTAWNAQDQKRLPALWEGFLAELEKSTNAFLQMEGRIGEFAEAKTSRKDVDDEWGKLSRPTEQAVKMIEALGVERDKKMEAAWTNLFEFVFSHYDRIVTGREQLQFIGLGVGDLNPRGGQVFSEALDNTYRTVYAPKLNALRDDYNNRFDKQLKEMQGLVTFKEQKNYLAKFTPYNAAAFNRLFGNQTYSKAQAAELKPLFEAYRSNLVAQATDENSKFFAADADGRIKAFYEDRLDGILNAPAPQAVSAAPTASAPPPAVKPVIAEPDNTTNALVAKRFFAFPTNELPAINIARLIVFSHRMRDDKLLLDLRYGDHRWVYETTNSSREVTGYGEAAAIFQSHVGWRTIAFPYHEHSLAGIMDFSEGNIRAAAGLGTTFYLEIFENDLYVSDDDAIRRYDVKRKEWQELPFPGQERAQLFAVDNHLYAASPEGIWEILDGGQSAKILASVRRRPAVSLLDSRDDLGRPILFSGKDHLLWAALDGEILSWDGKDWNPVLKIEDARRPEVFDGTAFFRTGKPQQSMELWRLSPNEIQPVLCLRESRRPLPGAFNAPQASARRNGSPSEPLWKSSSGAGLVRNPLAIDGETVYVVSVPLETTRTGTSDTMRNGRRIEPTLVCLVPGFREPLIIPVRLDSSSGPITALGGTTGRVPIWIECSSEYLFLGASTLPGVWVLPKAEIQAEIERRIQARPPESRSSQKKETAEDRRKALLAKYDLNHNGQFDPEEKEAAISDPAFLEFEMDKIDANINGEIDPEELSYFDANNNRTLDAPELAGIRAMQHILAVKALKEFDLDESGRLEQLEYWNFTRNKRPSEAGFHAMQFLPSNSETERIEHYLEAATEEMLQTTLTRMVPGEISHRPGYGRPQTDQMFKEEIEIYWARQNAAGIYQKPRTETRDSSKDSAP